MDAKSIHSYDILWPISAFLHTLGEGRGEAMLALLPYDRAAAVRYAHIWAYGRNPRYYDYESIGGDCTNFASQCIYAGAGVMNDTPTFGWYYINANDKAPAPTDSAGEYAYLVSLVRALPEGYRRVLELKLVEEQSNQEIARRLGLNESTVATRIQRGKAMLRERLKKEGYCYE